jgi:hypothetical protein
MTPRSYHLPVSAVSFGWDRTHDALLVVPSGSEIMVRGECSGTADALSACVYGVS